jgi:hypothetical protein
MSKFYSKHIDQHLEGVFYPGRTPPDQWTNYSFQPICGAVILFESDDVCVEDYDPEKHKVACSACLDIASLYLLGTTNL